MATSIPGFSILRMALLGTTALALFHPGIASARVGVTSATDGDPRGKPPALPERVLRIGIDVQANEVVTTAANDRAHLVFLDGTSLTVGPNAQLTIDRFVYDPATKTGDLAINASRGVFRLVGGRISKSSPITITTPSSTIGIRGGMALFTVTASLTTSTLLHGKMTVEALGVTQTATVPSTQVTTNVNQPPGPPTIAPKGALAGVSGNFEGSGSGGGTGPGGNADGGAAAFGAGNSNLGAQGVNAPPATTTGGSGTATTGTALSSQDVVSRSTTESQNSTTRTTTDTTPTAASTRVIVTRGRLMADPLTSSFDSTTLAATYRPANNQLLQPTGRVTLASPSVATITAADGASLVVPWRPGEDFTFVGTTIAGGTATGRGIVSPSEDFFAYVLTDATGQRTSVFGGTPTTTAQFPTTDFASSTLYNLGESGNLPFAPPSVGGDADLKRDATVSPLRSVYSPRLSAVVPAGVSANQGAQSFQVTVAISGTGAGQKSFMSTFIGDYFNDFNNNSIFNSGAVRGTYRVASSQPIGRLISAISTADTGQGNAIFGPNAERMVLTTDSLGSTVTGTSGTTRRTPQLALNQPNITGEGYFTLNAAVRDSTSPVSASTRTDRTLQGFVGGLVEGRQPGDVFSTRVIGNTDASGVSLTTSATNNRAQGTIVLQDFGVAGATVTFELGSTTGGRNANSAFIDDKIYGMSNVDTATRFSNVSVGGSGGAIPVTSRMALASYDSATVPQFFAAQGVTPCTCDFLSWGWWGGEARYDVAGYRQGERDRLNLATYVTGVTSTVAQISAQTGMATYTGHMVGNVQFGSSAYVAAGTYVNSWNFGSRSGAVAGSFDGIGLVGTTTLTSNGPGFSGSLAVTGMTGGATVNGAFFSGPTNTAAGQAGNFSILGTRSASAYSAAGTFAAQRSDTGTAAAARR